MPRAHRGRARITVNAGLPTASRESAFTVLGQRARHLIRYRSRTGSGNRTLLMPDLNPTPTLTSNVANHPCSRSGATGNRRSLRQWKTTRNSTARTSLIPRGGGGRTAPSLAWSRFFKRRSTGTTAVTARSATLASKPSAAGSWRGTLRRRKGPSPRGSGPGLRETSASLHHHSCPRGREEGTTPVVAVIRSRAWRTIRGAGLYSGCEWWGSWVKS